MIKELQIASISIPFLPALGADLDGGTFAGITTTKDGTHCAVVLLTQQATKITWDNATAWAKEHGGELPTRPVAALLFANLKPLLAPRWHWTCETEEDDASYAWYCYFTTGRQFGFHKRYEGSAVAVRLIPITA